jgi:hypothetical protein
MGGFDAPCDNRRMMRGSIRGIAGRVLLAVLVAAAVAYVADYGVWRVRMAHGAGMRTVAVDQYLATALKGNKAEYDYLGTVQQPCSRSGFPHGGAQPCWWLARHTTQWE